MKEQKAGGQPSVVGLVVAGGKSQRFGSPKALFVIDGEGMGVRVYRVVRSVIRDVRIGLATAGDPSPVPGAAVIFDEPQGVGPLGSLRSMLALNVADWVLLAGCDMPGLEPVDVETLLRARDSGLDAVVAVDRRGDTHPLFACYAASALPAVDALLASGRRSMRALVDSVDHCRVEFDDRAILNVNRPGDLIGLSPDRSYPRRREA